MAGGPGGRGLGKLGSSGAELLKRESVFGPLSLRRGAPWWEEESPTQFQAYKGAFLGGALRLKLLYPRLASIGPLSESFVRQC